MIKVLLNNFVLRIKKNTFIKNVLWIAGGTAMAQAIGILTTPIITRLYSPADFGIFTVFASLIGIARQLATMCYSVTIPLAETEQIADNIIKLCLLITFSLSLLFGLVCLLFGDYITAKIDVPLAVKYLWILPFCFLGAGLYETFSAWAQRNKYFRNIARTSLSQGISSSSIKIGMGLLGIKPLGLLLGLLASQMAGTMSLFLKFVRRKKSFFRNFSWWNIGHVAKRYYMFPVYQSWSRLLLALGAQLPALLMTYFFGIKEAGLFGLAHSMFNIPMDLIGTSIAKVYYAEIANYGKSRPDKILEISKSIIKKMFFVGIIPMATIVIVGPWLFSIVFGNEWWDAGLYARLLAIIILTRFLASPIAQCFNVMEMQGTQLLLNVVRVIMILIIFWACSYFSFSSFTTINIYSVLMSVYYFFVMVVILLSIKKLNIKMKEGIK
jgi:O-antigen/teichoic acid export membrane protein